jgi:D-3-phosphoglycerate dehydrogenase
MAPIVLITAPAHPCLQEALEKAGYAVEQQLRPTNDWLMQHIHRFTGMVISTQPKITQAVIDAATQLKWIARLGSGMEHIDTAYAALKGINCVSSAEGNCGAVGEHVLGMLLNLLKCMQWCAEEVKEGKWIRDMQRGQELSGKKVGIIGYGHTGAAFARLLSSFDVEVLAHDKYKQGFANAYVKEASLEQIQQHAQVVSLHLPLTEETYHYADAAFFGALQQQPYFLNSARGALVNTPDLCAALEQHQICAAGLDVLENEQPDTYTETENSYRQYLLQHKRVLITPHIAGYSQEAFRKMSEVILRKLGL